MKSRWMLRVAKFAAVMVAGLAALSVLVMVLWNVLIPDIFHGPAVTFWQALGLLVLAHVLLRGWGPWGHAHGWRHDRWKHKLEEKLAAMTPEEKEKFREEWRRRCGWSPEDLHPKKDQPAA